MIFLIPFFLLLDSFSLPLLELPDAVELCDPSVVPFVVASVFGASAEVAALEEESCAGFASLPEVALSLELSAVPVVASSGFAGVGSPGFTVSTTAGEVPEGLPPGAPGALTSVARLPPASVSVSGFSASGCICGVP